MLKKSRLSRPRNCRRIKEAIKRLLQGRQQSCYPMRNRLARGRKKYCCQPWASSGFGSRSAAVINKLRATLGGVPIETAGLAKPQEGLRAPHVAGKPSVNPELIKKVVERLSFSREIEKVVSESAKQLGGLVTEIKADQELQRDPERVNENETLPANI